METNLKDFNNIPKKIISSQFIPETASSFSDLLFFKNWLVGFSNAEGSFFKKIAPNGDCCFQLKQVTHIELFESIKTELSVNCRTAQKMGGYPHIEKSLTNSYVVISLSSKEDIQEVINFFSFKGLHPLKGLKYIQYLKWLKLLKDSNRYKNLILPSI